jgi:hypothetical protein
MSQLLQVKNAQVTVLCNYLCSAACPETQLQVVLWTARDRCCKSSFAQYSRKPPQTFAFASTRLAPH